MGRPIIHVDGWFIEWTTITDSPYSYGMREAEFREYYRDTYGSEGYRDLDDRLARALAQGTSSHLGESAEDLVCANHAGYGETRLTLAEIVQIYCVEQREPREGEGRVVQYNDEGDEVEPSE